MVETIDSPTIDPEVPTRETIDPNKRVVANREAKGVRERDRHPSDANPLQTRGRALRRMRHLEPISRDEAVASQPASGEKKPTHDSRRKIQKCDRTKETARQAQTVKKVLTADQTEIAELRVIAEQPALADQRVPADQQVLADQQASEAQPANDVKLANADHPEQADRWATEDRLVDVRTAHPPVQIVRQAVVVLLAVVVRQAVDVRQAAAEASRWDLEPATVAEDLRGRVKAREAKEAEVVVALDQQEVDQQEVAVEKHPEARKAARGAEKADRLAAEAKTSLYYRNLKFSYALWSHRD